MKNFCKAILYGAVITFLGYRLACTWYDIGTDEAAKKVIAYCEEHPSQTMKEFLDSLK